jgi:signal transduction histidine kinase
MKLLAKTNTYYLLFILALAPVMIAVDYYLIRFVVNKEVNSLLEHERERIEYQLARKGEISGSEHLFAVMPTDPTAPDRRQFKDTVFYEAATDRLTPYRIYEFTARAGTERLTISLRHILLEMKALIGWLFAGTTVILLLLSAGLFLINRRLSHWVWRPFYQNLAELKRYDVSKKSPVQLESSGISEFATLNRVITRLMNQVEKDFQNLKEFNENISHEMQTPLAIIRNKMVLLLESQHLGEPELQWVQAAYQEANKLSKIGKSLTLISRIENQEFTRLENVDIRVTIDNILRNMEEIIRFKNLELTADLAAVHLQCDPILANILFTNLIKNAIQHNQEGGWIRLRLNEQQFTIENTGEVLDTETTPLFNRFQKGQTATDNLGLGLAISQRICELYGFRLTYEHHDGQHQFSLFFDPSKDAEA